jgi:hypothetical protein
VTLHETHPGETAGGGGGAHEVPPVAPGRPTSIGPAAIVAVIGVVVVVVFSVLALVAGGTHGRDHRVTPGPVSGTTLRAVPGRVLLGPLVRGAEPPGNVVAAVALPAGAVRVSVHDRGAGLGQYDRQATFTVRATQHDAYAFFRTEMRRAGWSVSDAGPTGARGDVEVLGKMAGDDGWYWEMGATVSPSTFATTAAGPGTGPATTRVTVRLFQVSDES